MEMEEEVIDLGELFVAIKKKWWLVASLTIIAALISGLISFYLITPVYQADTTLIVKTEKLEDSQIISRDQVDVTQKLAVTYGEIIKSRTVLEAVISNLKLQENYSDLLGKISVSTVTDTQIIKVSVQDTDRIEAMNIANEIPKVFAKEVVRIADANGIEVIDAAKKPVKPVKPSKKKNIAIAAVAGMMLALGIIFIIEFFNNKIKKPQDVEKILGLPVLGVISYENK